MGKPTSVQSGTCTLTKACELKKQLSWGFVHPAACIIDNREKRLGQRIHFSLQGRMVRPGPSQWWTHTTPGVYTSFLPLLFFCCLLPFVASFCAEDGKERWRSMEAT
ncbi:hypothetical protein CGRA01v4_05043 [Colletotrichum graminicola]|nr:hypothetical protein CGRA01v4_05043 [Colletotrichum graminicola]